MYKKSAEKLFQNLNSKTTKSLVEKVVIEIKNITEKKFGECFGFIYVFDEKLHKARR